MHIFLDPLSLFGLISVILMLIFYALEERSHWFILLFSLSCVLGSIYGFLQGAWPFGLVEIAWTIVVFRKWVQVKYKDSHGHHSGH